MLGGILGWNWPRESRLTFLNVGQGDCAVFQTEGATILIDTGPKDEFKDAGDKIVVPKLRQLGVDSVDLILLSHPDMDHIGGTGAILKQYPNASIAISAVYRHNSQLLKQLILWNRAPESIHWLRSEWQGSVGGFKLRIDCPLVSEQAETNDGSMFVKFEESAASVVFTGDAPVVTETEMEKVGDWNAEILKAGHHGSRSATSEEWLRMVRPQYAVLSCGLNNRYGHPHREVLDRLKQDGISALRTDREGDISFTFAGGRFVRQ